MSRIGNKPIAVPADVKVEVEGRSVQVSGKLGSLSRAAHPSTSVSYDHEQRQIVLNRTRETRSARALHGLDRSLIANMVKGVSEGFEKQLEVIGTGYSVALKGNSLAMRVGYSHLVELQVPEGLTVEVRQAANPGRLTIRGADKQAVGQFSAEVRSVRPPEPYKGKGIKYTEEVIRRKAGKTLTSSE